MNNKIQRHWYSYHQHSQQKHISVALGCHNNFPIIQPNLGAIIQNQNCS